MQQPQFKTLGEIEGTNTVRFKSGANGLSIALHLLSTRTHGAPVVGDDGRFVGFVSEFDLLKALEDGRDLNTIQAQEIMAKDLKSLSEATPIQEAVDQMEKMHLLSLPVVDKEGKIVKTVTRHDLLRAWLGVGLAVEAL